MRRSVILGTVVVGWALLYWRGRGPGDLLVKAKPSTPVLPVVVSQGTQEKPFATTAPINSLVQKRSVEQRIPDQDRQIMIACVRGSETFGGQSVATDIDSYGTFLSRTRGGQMPSRSIQKVNLHGTNAAGEERRLSIGLFQSGPENGSEDEQTKLQPRLFAVDREGLPLPLPDNEYRNLSVTDAIERFRASTSSISFEERIEETRWQGGESAKTTLRNGRPAEFQIFMTDGKSLACAKKCRCFSLN